jgi:hypothetical protein
VRLQNRRKMREATRRNRLRHGLYTMRKALQMLGSRALPAASTALGRELRLWRKALITDLGGQEIITTQQEALIDAAVRTKLLLDSVDAYVLEMGSPVDRRHRRLWPVVRERQSLVAQLQSLLRDLGLSRRAKEVPTLQAYLAQKATPKMDTDTKADTPPPKMDTKVDTPTS